MDNHVSVVRGFTCYIVLIAISCGASTPLDTGSDAGPDGDDPAVTYGAVGFGTAMVRFAVFKQDTSNDLCTVVAFVWPIDSGTPEVELPERWALERAWRGTASTCDEVEDHPYAYDAPDGVVWATTASGWGDWDESLCAIDVDILLEYEGAPSERLQADDIALGWGGCE